MAHHHRPQHNTSGPSLGEHVFTCDVVYRWINPRSVSHAVSNAQRYRDNGELRYSMRSFARVDGVRYMHTVAKGEPPVWLDVAHPRIFWWNETKLLLELRAERDIDGPFAVFNSEPVKLVLARLPNLAERFLLVDDDFFLIPRLDAMVRRGLSTRLFFDKDGVPLQPKPCRFAHRPIPLLRSAYANAVRAEPRSTLERLLNSQQARTVRRVDRLPDWCNAMLQAGSARPVDVIVVRADCHLYPIPAASCAASRHRPNGTLPPPIESEDGFPSTSYWLNAKPPAKISRTVASAFFDSVQTFRPVFLCVNDDWPDDDAERIEAIQPFYEFLASTYPGREGWEIAEPLSNSASVAARLQWLGDTLAFPVQAANAPRHVNSARSHSCTGSKDVLSLRDAAFTMPVGLMPLLSQLNSSRRAELRNNPLNLSADELTASIANLDHVDVDNTISVAAPLPVDGILTVAELNAERGRFWCEFAVEIRGNPALHAVDIWMLNEFDIGMARSEQQHTVRLLAHALGMNYAWATEFVELTNGQRQEQERVGGQENLYGLHGNAILSRWPLHDAAVIRMPGITPLYIGSARDTAGGYEKRLGSRMTLFASTNVGFQLLVGATHAQTSWRNDATHTGPALAAITKHIAATSHPGAASPVLVGGDTWTTMCDRLGLAGLVNSKGPTNRVVSRGKQRGEVHLSPSGNDDYICGRGFSRVGDVTRLPCAGRPVGGGPQFVLSDHTYVVISVRATGPLPAAGSTVSSALTPTAVPTATQLVAAASGGRRLFAARPGVGGPLARECDTCIHRKQLCSQKRQDVWIQQTLVPHLDAAAAFFVDLAANHPVCHSNSVALERAHGWRGLCIEANPTYAALLREQRNCTVRESAVTNQDGMPMTFTGGGETGGLVSPEFDHTSKLVGQHSFNVSTRRLDSLLREVNAPGTISYLSLDVEGAEATALPDDFAWDTYRFLAVTVERAPPQLIRRLFTRGYLFVMNSFFDTFFVHASHPRAAMVAQNASFALVPAKCTHGIPGRRHINGSRCRECCEHASFPQELFRYDRQSYRLGLR